MGIINRRQLFSTYGATMIDYANHTFASHEPTPSNHGPITVGTAIC